MQRFTVFFLTILSLVLECTISALAFTFTTIDPPGSIATTASTINDRGQIVGFFIDSKNVEQGFLRDTDGTFTTIDPPGSIATTASAINARGLIVGSFDDSNGEHGFLAVP